MTPTPTDITTDQILDAALDGVADYRTCWDALAEPSPARHQARMAICEALLRRWRTNGR